MSYNPENGPPTNRDEIVQNASLADNGEVFYSRKPIHTNYEFRSEKILEKLGERALSRSYRDEFDLSRIDLARSMSLQDRLASFMTMRTAFSVFGDDISLRAGVFRGNQKPNWHVDSCVPGQDGWVASIGEQTLAREGLFTRHRDQHTGRAQIIAHEVVQEHQTREGYWSSIPAVTVHAEPPCNDEFRL